MNFSWLLPFPGCLQKAWVVTFRSYKMVFKKKETTSDPFMIMAYNICDMMKQTGGFTE